MKISILSDLHLDFWVKPTSHKRERLFKVLDLALDRSSDIEVLIVAGDISHYPSQLKLLEEISQKYNYKKVFCVLGNHELYLVSNEQTDTYKTSAGKQQAYYSYKSDVIKMLDGAIVEYKGIKFGGCMSWYDASYKGLPSYSREDPVLMWKRTMNDANYIKGYKDFYSIWAEEKPKIEAILEADIVITHVCPSIELDAFVSQYRYESTNMFFSFNGDVRIAF